MANADRLYLKRHGEQWRVDIKVPEKLREAIGKAHLVRGLGTSSLAEANRLKWPVVAEFKAEIEKARRTPKKPAVQNLVEETHPLLAGPA